MSEGNVGLLMGAFRIAPIVLLVPFGMLGDRLTPRWLITGGLAVFAAALALAVPAESFLLLLVLFLVAGMAGSLFQVNNQATYYKTLGASSRGAKLGWFSAVRAMGFGVGPVVAGVLMHKGWVESPMTVGFCFILPFVFLSLLCERVPGTRISLPEYTRDALQPGVLVLALVVLLFSFHFGVELTSFSLFLEDVLHQDKKMMGLTYLYISVVLAVVMLLTGVLSDRVHRPRPLGVIALVCSGIGNGAMPWVSTLGPLLTLRLVHVIGDGAFIMFQSLTIAGLFHRKRMGGNLGLFVMVGNIGAFVGATASGYIPGNATPFLVAGVLAFVGIAVFLVFGKPLWEPVQTSSDDTQSTPLEAR